MFVLVKQQNKWCYNNILEPTSNHQCLTSFKSGINSLVIRHWYANAKVSYLSLYGCIIFKDLCFVHLNKELAKIFTKLSKGLIKTAKDF